MENKKHLLCIYFVVKYKVIKSIENTQVWRFWYYISNNNIFSERNNQRNKKISNFLRIEKNRTVSVIKTALLNRLYEINPSLSGIKVSVTFINLLSTAHK